MSRRDFITLSILCTLIALIALPILTYPLGRDQGEFSTIGQGILDGKVPYIDLWNPKPPAIFYVYATAIWLLGETVVATRAIDLVIFPVIAVALYWCSLKLTNRRSATIAVVGMATFYFTESFWTLTQNDGIALAPMTLAVTFSLKTFEDGKYHWVWSALSGAMCAIAAWFKYPFLLLALALALGYGITNQRDIRTIIKDTLAFSIAGLTIGIGGLLYLDSKGALGEMIESARVTSAYTRQGYDELFQSAVWKQALEDRLAHWRPLIYLNLAWPILHIAIPCPHSRGGWHTIWLWSAAAGAMMLVQAKGYDYHWLPLLPPMILVSADSLDHISNGLWRFFNTKVHISSQVWNSGIQSVLLVGLLLTLFIDLWRPAWPYISGKQQQSTYWSQFRGGEFVADESLAVSNYLEQRVPPDEYLYIWGFRTEIYYMTQLRPATRFIFHFPLIADWYPAQWRDENVSRLWQVLPPYVLVLQVDYMPWVTGRHEDSHVLLQEYTELNNWLMFNYERETQIGNFFIWRRRE